MQESGPGIPGQAGGWPERSGIRSIITEVLSPGKLKRETGPESDFMQDIHIWSVPALILNSVWEGGPGWIGTVDIPASSAGSRRRLASAGSYFLMI